MKTILRRVGRLEDQFETLMGKPKTSLRFIMSLPWKGPANLATSTCKRYIRASCLTEVVKLDGDGTGMSDDELERFVASFPIDFPERARSR